jgi:GT2 family glycosyltransferase
MPQAQDVTVVIATRDRAGELCRTLAKLAVLPEGPQVIVVDNASRDGTAGIVRRLYRTSSSSGCAATAAPARTPACGAATRYVAFSDDDSWWEPGALARACALLDECPAVGVVAGRTLVGPKRAEDPLNDVMAGSPLPRDHLPGPRVLGFLGCAIVARREAFLAAGGYRRLLGIGGEEELLVLDLAARGWASVYAEAVVARHLPSPRRDVPGRRAAAQRNRVLIAFLRRPPRRALAGAAALARRAARRDAVARSALAGLLLRLPLALAARRPLPPAVAAQAATLETA